MPKVPRQTFWDWLGVERQRNPLKAYSASQLSWNEYHRSYAYVLYEWRLGLKKPRRQAYIHREFLKRRRIAEQEHQASLEICPIEEWEFQTK